MSNTLLVRWQDDNPIRIACAAEVGDFLDQVVAAPPGYSMAQFFMAEQPRLSCGDLGELPATVLTVAARPDGAALRFLDHTTDAPGLYSAGGDNTDIVSYSLMMDEDDFPPGARIPLAAAKQALIEYLTTGQRPTCVAWQTDPW